MYGLGRKFEDITCKINCLFYNDTPNDMPVGEGVFYSYLHFTKNSFHILSGLVAKNFPFSTLMSSVDSYLKGVLHVWNFPQCGVTFLI